jgi:hypothetical protein
MPLDKELEDAIRSAVSGANQPASVAQRLVAWIKDLSESDLGPEDQVRHLDNVRTALNTKEAAHED